MKKLMLFLFVFSGFSVFAQVHWMSMAEALAAQKKNPRKIIIQFYSDNCISCNDMTKKTFSHPVISSYVNAHFYPVKFNWESRERFSILGRNFYNQADTAGKPSTNDFTRYLDVSMVPSIVFLDESCNLITKLQGMLTAKELEPYLPWVVQNVYRKISTKDQWNSYQKKYHSNIK